MNDPFIERLPIRQYRDGQFTTHTDELAVEAPLQIYIEHGPATDRRTQKLSVTMRTPGHDEDLCVGFLFTEGILQAASQLQSVALWGDGVRAVLAPEVQLEMTQLERNFFTNSSCGVCGKTDVAALQGLPRPALSNTPATLPPADLLLSLPQTLRQAQAQFERTGGIHASGLFGPEGQLLCLREDVGRHNALDKLIGHYLRTEGRLPNDTLLLLSGRASFELLQKAATAQIPVVCAVGAPSSLAVETARKAGICLVGFLREGRFNVYVG